MNKRSFVSMSDLMLELPRNQRHVAGDEALLSRVGRGVMRQLKRSIRKGQRLARLPGALLAKLEEALLWVALLCGSIGRFVRKYLQPCSRRNTNEENPDHRRCWICRSAVL